MRTVNFLRVAENGIDFVTKKRNIFVKSQNPLSLLYTDGRYRIGEIVAQWRADGICEEIELLDVINKIPSYTRTEMVASSRARALNHKEVGVISNDKLKVMSS